MQSREELKQHLDDLTSIKEWHQKQPHLNFPIDDELILTFLRCCKFRVERTKEKIDYYYAMRSYASDILSDRDPLLPEIQSILNAGTILPLPNPDSNGCRILFCNYSSNLNPDTMHCFNIIKAYSMVIDIMLREDENAIAFGLKTWYQLKNCPIKYVTQVTPTFVKKASYLTEKGLPFAVKGIYNTNCPSVLEFMFNICKRIFPKKIVARLFVYSEDNFNQLYSNIPQFLLPEEYGGTNGSIKQLTIIWKKKVESYREWFIKEEKYKSNEELRQGKLNIDCDIFGVAGSFKKLQID